MDEYQKLSIKIKKYEIAVDRVMNEGSILWQSSQAFLLTNAVILGFISQSLFHNKNLVSFEPNIGIFSLAFIGLLVCILWLTSYVRRSDYYRLLITQALNSEPKEWNFLKEGKWFSDGHDALLGEEKRMHLSLLGRLRTRYSALTLIVLFITIYILVLLVTSPWNIVPR
jgi:ABC-type branched-subunit amino acid transport system permease subunit